MTSEYTHIYHAASLDRTTANRTVAQMRCGCTELLEEDLFCTENPWRDSCHIATTEVRLNCAHRLFGEECTEQLALVDIRLTEELPDIALFHNILDVNSIGLWYYNLLSDEEVDTLRQRVIPWDFIESVTLHSLV